MANDWPEGLRDGVGAINDLSFQQLNFFSMGAMLEHAGPGGGPLSDTSFPGLGTAFDTIDTGQRPRLIQLQFCDGDNGRIIYFTTDEANNNSSFRVVPEPSSAIIGYVGLIVLTGRRRRLTKQTPLSVDRQDHHSLQRGCWV